MHKNKTTTSGSMIIQITFENYHVQSKARSTSESCNKTELKSIGLNIRINKVNSMNNTKCATQLKNILHSHSRNIKQTRSAHKLRYARKSTQQSHVNKNIIMHQLNASKIDISKRRSIDTCICIVHT